jgi:S1-C subfamily serine protease
MLATLSKRTKLVAAASVLVLAITARPALADDADLYAKTLPATAWISVPGLGDGTGWVVDRDQKLVVTNKHVVGDKNDAIIMFPIYERGRLLTYEGDYLQRGTRAIKGKVLARDAKRDLALIQLEAMPEDVGVLKLAEQSAKVGDSILSIGNSGLAGKARGEGSLWKMRTGKVSQKLFKVMTYINVNQKLETSMLNSSLHTSPGDSGGPVVNQKGELIAVTSGGNAIDSFAVDVTEVRYFLGKALESGRRLPSISPALTGTWTQSWVTNNGQRVFAGLTLRNDGTVLWEDGTGAVEGTFSVKDGRLTINLPGRAFEITSEVTWNGNDSFRITGAGIEYTMDRR